MGSVAGLIVSSWQGFKDPPWEGFSMSKFLRSIIVGIAAGVGLCTFRESAAHNLGILAFAVVAVERVIGEAYKGFFRRGEHDEYYRLLRRMSIGKSAYPARVTLGLGFIIGAYWLFRLLAWWLARMAMVQENLSLAGLLVGVAGGILVATAGLSKTLSSKASYR